MRLVTPAEAIIERAGAPAIITAFRQRSRHQPSATEPRDMVRELHSKRRRHILLSLAMPYYIIYLRPTASAHGLYAPPRARVYSAARPTIHGATIIHSAGISKAEQKRLLWSRLRAFSLISILMQLAIFRAPITLTI